MNTEANEEVLRTRLGRHATAGLASAIIIRGLGLVLVKSLSIFLTKEDYGTYALWLSLVFLISTISTSPFSATLWRFLQKKRIDAPLESSRLLALCFTGAAVVLIIAFGSIAFLFVYFGIKIINDSLYLSSLVVAGILTAFYVIKEYVLVVSGTEQNSREIFIFNLTFGIGSTFAAIVMAILFSNLLLVLVGLCLGYAIPSIISLALKLKQYHIAMVSRDDTKLVASFGGPVMVANSTANALPFITSYLVAVWIGLSEVGTLSIAQVIAGLLSFIMSPVLMAYNAYLILIFEKPDFEMGNKISAKMIELFISVTTPVILIIILFSSPLINLISTGEYLDATLLLPYTVIAVTIMTLSQFWKIRIELVKKTYISAAVYVTTTIVLIISSIAFLSLYGLVGIGYAIVLQSVLILAGMYIAANKQIPLRLSKKYFQSWIASAFLLIIFEALLRTIGVDSILSGVISSGAYLLSMTFTGAIKPREISSLLRTLLPR